VRASAKIDDQHFSYVWDLGCRRWEARYFLIFLFYMDMDCAGNEELAADRVLILPESVALRRCGGLYGLLAVMCGGEQLIEPAIAVQASQ
jgi:hypothetical protein